MRKHHPLIIFILSLLLSVIHAKQLCSEGVLSAKDLTTNTSSSQLCCHADCGSCGDEGRHHFKCAKKYRLKDVCCPRFIKYSGKSCATAQDVGCVIEAEGAAKKDRAVAATTLPVAVTAAAAAVTEEKTSFTDKPHHPSSWFTNSCAWYSQRVTAKLGKSRFDDYVQLLDYGNQDTRGDLGMNNGWSHCWLSSSLTISPKE